MKFSPYFLINLFIINSECRLSAYSESGGNARNGHAHTHIHMHAHQSARRNILGY